MGLNPAEQRRHRTALDELESHTAQAFEELENRVRREISALARTVASEVHSRNAAINMESKSREVMAEHIRLAIEVERRALQDDYMKETAPLRRPLWGRLKWLILGR